MKKISTIVCAILFCASLAFGDEVEERLSTMATEKLKASTREMIRSAINSDDAIKMTKLMLENQFRLEHALRAQEIVMNARKDDLPVGPVMNKAYEGMAKQVQDKNIVQAMERVRSRYAFAYQQAKAITQDRSQIQLIGNTIAQGLTAGMHNQDVGRIMQSFQYRVQQMTKTQAQELATETFRAARTIARLGVSSRVATDVICQALQYAYSAREMEIMRKSFMTHSRNTPPLSLARSYSKAIKAGKSAESLGSPSMGRASSTGGVGAPDSPSSPGGPGGPGGPGSGRHK